MHWLPWILFTATIVALVIVLMRKSRGLTGEEQQKLVDEKTKHIQKELDLEKIKSQKLEELAAKKKANLEQVNEWYEKAKADLDQESQKEYETLANDHDALFAEFDRQLSKTGPHPPEEG